MIGIVRNNNATFYNYNTGKPVKRWRSIAVVCVLACCFSVLFRNELGSFFGSVAAAQSILVGFSFSVMFFLLSSEVVTAPNDAASLEKKQKYEKLNKLCEELFYNVSYFNLVAIACVIVSLFLMLPPPAFGILSQFAGDLSGVDVGSAFSQFWSHAKFVTQSSLLFLFYLLMLESFSAFYRTALRVSYFFEQKLKYDAANTIQHLI